MSFNELIEFLFPVCVSNYFSLTKLSFLISETIFLQKRNVICYIIVQEMGDYPENALFYQKDNHSINTYNETKNMDVRNKFRKRKLCQRPINL